MDLFFPNFRSPFSDNWQKFFSSWFSPQTTINVAGKLPVEERVITDVASYGAQLGWITDIVLALAEKEGHKSDAVKKLSHAVERIKTIKAEHARSMEGEARNALDRLKRDNPEEFRKLVSNYWHDMNARPTNGSAI